MNTVRIWTSKLILGATVILALWKEDEVSLNFKPLPHVINPPMQMRKGLYYFITRKEDICKHEFFLFITSVIGINLSQFAKHTHNI